jgi:hypothetical protein
MTYAERIGTVQKTQNVLFKFKGPSTPYSAGIENTMAPVDHVVIHGDNH